MNEFLDLIAQSLLGAILFLGTLGGFWRKVPGRSYYRKYMLRGLGLGSALACLVTLGLTFLPYGRPEEVWPTVETGLLLLQSYMGVRLVFIVRQVARHLRKQGESPLPVELIHQGQKGVMLLMTLVFCRCGVILFSYVGAAYAAGAGLQLGLLSGTALFLALAYFTLSRIFAALPWVWTVHVSSLFGLLYAGANLIGGVELLIQLKVIPNPVPLLWDTTSLLPLRSYGGSLAYHLLGYRPAPSLSELFIYVCYWSVIWIIEYKQKLGSTADV
jgi:high-affinity iron transporter